MLFSEYLLFRLNLLVIYCAIYNSATAPHLVYRTKFVCTQGLLSLGLQEPLIVGVLGGFLLFVNLVEHHKMYIVPLPLLWTALLARYNSGPALEHTESVQALSNQRVKLDNNSQTWTALGFKLGASLEHLIIKGSLSHQRLMNANQFSTKLDVDPEWQPRF